MSCLDLSLICRHDGVVTSSETSRARLDRLMSDRRAQLGKLWNEVAADAGLTKEGLRAIRRGETIAIQPGSKRGIEDALSWERGSVDRILAGGDPTPVGRPDGGAVLDDLAQRPDEGPWGYLDRIIGAWQRERDFGRPEDQMRARVIRSVLDQEQDQDRDRDAG